MMGVFGLGQATTSMWTIARPISFSASSPVGGHLGSIYGERSMVISGSILIFMAMVAFAGGAAEESIGLILVGLVFAGLGMGLAQPSLSTLVASAVSEHDHGIAVSTLSTTSGIGAVAGISILTALCADAETGTAFRDGYGLGALVAAVGVVASFGLRAVSHESPTDGARESLDEEGLATVA
jgi:MFS family permease